MKSKFIFIFLFALLVTAVYAQQDLKITGHAPLLKDGTEIYLLPIYPRRYEQRQQMETGLEYKSPSLIVKNGSFSATYKVRNGNTYLLTIKGLDGFKEFCVASGELKINIPAENLKGITFEGNSTTITYQKYKQNLENSDIYVAYANARKDWINARVARNDKLVSEKAKLQDSLKAVLETFGYNMKMNYFKQHPESYFNTILLNQSFAYMSEDEIKKIFRSFPKTTVENSWGDNLRFAIDSLFIGSYAPSFKQADTAGKLVNSNIYRGKYVLVDFWASWCVPCRADNPNLIKAFNQYGNKNFTIVGVSLDDDKKKWIDAIKKDGLPWTHISDLKEFQNEIALSYDINAIPNNYLLDPQGKIIAKNLSGSQLLSKLEEILK